MAHQFYTLGAFVRMLKADAYQNGHCLRQDAPVATIVAEAYGEGIPPNIASLIAFSCEDAEAILEPIRLRKPTQRERLSQRLSA